MLLGEIFFSAESESNHRTGPLRHAHLRLNDKKVLHITSNIAENVIFRQS